MTYTIYHIPGVKVGCTIDFRRRKVEYARYHPEMLLDTIEILEILDNVSAREAGDREWELADMYGYDRGSHYSGPGSDEARANMSKRSLGKKKSKNHCENISKGMKNRTMTEENKARMRSAAAKRAADPVAKAKWQASMAANAHKRKTSIYT